VASQFQRAPLHAQVAVLAFTTIPHPDVSADEVRSSASPHLGWWVTAIQTITRRFCTPPCESGGLTRKCTAAALAHAAHAAGGLCNESTTVSSVSRALHPHQPMPCEVKDSHSRHE